MFFHQLRARWSVISAAARNRLPNPLTQRGSQDEWTKQRSTRCIRGRRHRGGRVLLVLLLAAEGEGTRRRDRHGRPVSFRPDPVRGRQARRPEGGRVSRRDGGLDVGRAAGRSLWASRSHREDQFLPADESVRDGVRQDGRRREGGHLGRLTPAERADLLVRSTTRSATRR